MKSTTFLKSFFLYFLVLFFITGCTQEFKTDLETPISTPISIKKVVGSTSVPNFAKGADVSYLNQFESYGYRWQGNDGYEQGVLKILKRKGINSVRLRVFVNPPSSGYDSFIKNDGSEGWFPIGFCDTASVVALAIRCKAEGFRIMIDFHYSDLFAGPGHHLKPVAWENKTFAQLKTAVYWHTHNVLLALYNAQVTPEWVQIGNEIDGGILSPEGDFVPNVSQMTQLLNRGYDAVYDINHYTNPNGTQIKVITHLATGTVKSDWFLNKFINDEGGKTDIIGLSYYPALQGIDYAQSIDDLAANLNFIAANYDKEVMICEVGGLEDTPGNTKALIEAVIQRVSAVPGGKGLGVFYWAPETNSTFGGGYRLGATEIVDNNPILAKFTTAIDAFENRVSNPGFELGSWEKWGNPANFTNSRNNAHRGNFCESAYSLNAFNGGEWQTITGLEDGYYTAKAWVKSSGGMSANTYLYAKNYGGADITRPLPTALIWTEIIVSPNLHVTNGQCVIGFCVNAPGGTWLNVDDFSFTKN